MYHLTTAFSKSSVFVRPHKNVSMRFQMSPDSEAFSNVSVFENEGLRFRSLQCGREVKTHRKRWCVVQALVSRSFLLWREFCDDRPMSHYHSRVMFLSSRVFFRWHCIIELPGNIHSFTGQQICTGDRL